MNINRYVPFLINTWDTMLRVGILLTVSDDGSYSLAPGLALKAMYHTHPFVGARDKDRILLIFSDSGGYSVEVAWCGVWGKPAFTSHSRPSSSLRMPSLQALTRLGATWFITCYLRCPFLREWRRSPEYFWSHRACLGNVSASRHTFKKSLCDTIYQPLRSGRIWHKVNF